MNLIYYYEGVMNESENKLPLIPLKESKRFTCSDGDDDEENDTINLENNSNDLVNGFQNFLISNGSNNGSCKGTKTKKDDALIRKENFRNLNLLKKKKNFIRKDAYGSNNLVLGGLRNNSKKLSMKRKFLWNCIDQNTNVSELSYIKDFENNNSFLHENNGHHMVLYDNKFRDYYPKYIKEERGDRIRNFFVYSPDIIQRWIRVIFNIIITSLIVTLIYYIFISVREDINKKVAIQVQNVKEESNSCRKQYNAHKCGTVNLPLLNEKCEEWAKCMKTDYKLYQDISFLSAQMLGQIINTFIVQFEWKSICVIAFIFLLIFIGSNYALSIGGYRSNNDYNSTYPNLNNNYNHLNNNNNNMSPYPYYPFYPIIPQPINYNNSGNPNMDIPIMNCMPSQNKFYRNSSFNRNAYTNSFMNNFHHNLNENDMGTHSSPRNKDFNETYSSSKKDQKRSSKKLGFLKYLSRD